MNKEFEFFDHTADAGIRAYGADLKETFANAAKALFSLIIELDEVQEVTHRDIEVTATDKESLLIEWLNELIFIFDVENILFKRFDIITLTDTGLKARSYGEKVDKSRHQIKIGIKAATYNMLKIDKPDSYYQAQFVLDI